MAASSSTIMDLKKRYPFLFQSSSSHQIGEELKPQRTGGAPSQEEEPQPPSTTRLALKKRYPFLFQSSSSKNSPPPMRPLTHDDSEQIHQRPSSNSSSDLPLIAPANFEPKSTIKNQLQELEGPLLTASELQQFVLSLFPWPATSTSSSTSSSASCSPPASTASKQLPLDTATAIAEDNIDGDGAAAEEGANPEGDQEEEEMGAAEVNPLPPKDSSAATFGAGVDPLPPKDSFAASIGEEMITLPSKDDFNTSASEASHILDDNEDEDEASVDDSAVTTIELQQLISPLSPSPATSTSSSTSSSASSTALKQEANPRGDLDQRLTAMMGAALVSRLKPSPIGDICSSEHRAATQMLYDASPIFKLGLEEELAVVFTFEGKKEDDVVVKMMMTLPRPPPEPPPELLLDLEDKVEVRGGELMHAFLSFPCHVS